MISSIIASNSPDRHRIESFQLTDKWEDDYGSGGDRHNLEYWHARRAFLNSFHFEEEDGFKDKLKRSVDAATDVVVNFRRELSKRRFKDVLQRSVKGVNDTVMSAAMDFGRELSRRRLGIRSFKFKLNMSSLVFVTFKCYTPWLKKKEYIQPY